MFQFETENRNVFKKSAKSTYRFRYTGNREIDETLATIRGRFYFAGDPSLHPVRNGGRKPFGKTNLAVGRRPNLLLQKDFRTSLPQREGGGVPPPLSKRPSAATAAQPGSRSF